MSDSVASVLVIALDAPADRPTVSYVMTPDRARSLQLLTLMQVDLVVAGAVDALPLAVFARQLRLTSRQQKWLLVGPGISESDERLARSLGAAAVLDVTGDWSDIDAIATRICLRRQDAFPARPVEISLARQFVGGF